jgi:hypothetical protein
VLGASLAWLATGTLGCGAQEPPRSRAPEGAAPPVLPIGRLTDLCPLAGLTWALALEPAAIAGVPWLEPVVHAVATEDGLSRYAQTTGLDLRRLREAVVASYATGEGDATAYLVRHDADPRALERRFRSRLTRGERSVVLRPGVSVVSGTLGLRSQAVALLGRDVACFQHDGSMSRGPARVAALYATGELRRAPTALAGEPLRPLAERLGRAPALALAPGPFEGPLARGLRGLLAGATAAGAALRPTAAKTLALDAVVTGAFGDDAPAAADELARSWGELASSQPGRLLGLDAPAREPALSSGRDAIGLSVELDPARLARGLAAVATSLGADRML